MSKKEKKKNGGSWRKIKRGLQPLRKMGRNLDDDQSALSAVLTWVTP